MACTDRHTCTHAASGPGSDPHVSLLYLQQHMREFKFNGYTQPFFYAGFLHCPLALTSKQPHSRAVLHISTLLMVWLQENWEDLWQTPLLILALSTARKLRSRAVVESLSHHLRRGKGFSSSALMGLLHTGIGFWHRL